MFRTLVLALLILIANISFVAAQSETSAPTKKANQRPSAKSSKAPKGEPFDDASTEKMEQSCVRLETEAGNIELEMFANSAPETVRNFLNLTAIGFFDTTTFSRVVPNFVIQGGSLSTSQKATKELVERGHRTIKDEPGMIRHERGIVSMARTDEPHSASTHFFILVAEAQHLDGKFSAFARVTQGIEVVDTINKADAVDEKPSKPVRINKAVIFPCVAEPTENPNRVI